MDIGNWISLGGLASQLSSQEHLSSALPDLESRRKSVEGSSSSGAKDAWAKAAGPRGKLYRHGLYQGKKRGLLACAGRKGKGTKITALVEAHGLPIAVDVAGGNQHDATLVELLYDVALFRMPKPHHMIGDTQYSSKPLTMRLLSKHHTLLTAPPKRHYVHPFHDGRTLRRKKRRWKIERCFSWLRGHKRLECRWERCHENFLGFVRLACALILMHRLII